MLIYFVFGHKVFQACDVQLVLEVIRGRYFSFKTDLPGVQSLVIDHPWREPEREGSATVRTKSDTSPFSVSVGDKTVYWSRNVCMSVLLKTLSYQWGWPSSIWRLYLIEFIGTGDMKLDCKGLTRPFFRSRTIESGWYILWNARLVRLYRFLFILKSSYTRPLWYKTLIKEYAYPWTASMGTL